MADRIVYSGMTDIFDKSLLEKLGLSELKPIIGPWENEEHMLRIEAECLLAAAYTVLNEQGMSQQIRKQTARILMNLFRDRKSKVEAIQESGV